MGNRGSSTSSRPLPSSEANIYAKLQDHIQRQTRPFSGEDILMAGDKILYNTLKIIT